MEAEESETATEVSTIIDDVWQLLLDCDKSGKDAVKAKIKEVKKRNKKKAEKPEAKGEKEGDEGAPIISEGKREAQVLRLGFVVHGQ